MPGRGDTHYSPTHDINRRYMLLVLEIILVLGAWAVLAGSGVMAGKSAVRFGKTTKRVASDVQPKVMHLMDDGDQAARRALGLAEARDTLLLRVAVVRSTIGQLLVTLRALNEIRSKVSRLLEYVGR